MSRTRTVPWRNARGLTLVEVALTMLLLLLITGFVLRSQMATRRAQVQMDMALRAQQAARQAIDAVSRELRLASPVRLNPTALGVPLGAINSSFLFFQTAAYDPATQARVNSNWILYQLVDDPTSPVPQVMQLQRVQFAEGGLDYTLAVTPVSTRVIARNIYSEDLNGNGFQDPGEPDANGDGQFQLGLWFTIEQEDVNDDDLMGVIEDTNANELLDARITVIVDTRAAAAATGGLGFATVTTTVEARNADSQVI